VEYWRLVDAVFRDHHQFAGQHIAQVFGAEQVECARLAEAKMMVSACRSAFFIRPIESGLNPRGSRAAKIRSRVIITIENAPSTLARATPQSHPQALQRWECAMSWTMISESLVVWKVGAIAFQRRAQVAQVYQVAVMGNRDETLGGVNADGLRIEQRRVAGGGVAGVANGHGAGQLGQHVVGEDFAHQAHALDVGQVLAVGGGDACRLLSAMLKCVERKIGLTRGMRMPVNGYDTAFFVQSIAVRDALRGLRDIETRD
jgi:hypothetical protein